MTSTSAAESSAPAAASTSASNDSVLISKLTQQVKKLTDANTKYKNLLKLAKERIQQQEQELEELQNSQAQLQIQLANYSTNNNNSNNNNNNPADSFFGESASPHPSANNHTAVSQYLDETNAILNNSNMHIVRVCQRIRERSKHTSSSENNNNNNAAETIWALLEVAPRSDPEDPTPPPPQSSSSSSSLYIWKSFDSEAALNDFVQSRNHTSGGEPLQLPPYSLTAEQSQALQTHSQQAVAAVTEEFRRFRVKAELHRKQADQHIHQLTQQKKVYEMQSLQQHEPPSSSTTTSSSSSSSRPQNNHSHSASQTLPSQSPQSSSQSSAQVQQLRHQLQSQEAYWKAEYDTLLQENNALKAAGSEALLASQWRQRYETVVTEKEHLTKQLQILQESEQHTAYEEKYRDLKESFRLYRKKAKEIFETQPSQSSIEHLADNGSADAKLGYLRNIVVQYLTITDDDASVKNPMEAAMGTILQFSPDDVQKIEDARAAKEAWF